jgi:hypothetical protein
MSDTEPVVYWQLVELWFENNVEKIRDEFLDLGLSDNLLSDGIRAYYAEGEIDTLVKAVREHAPGLEIPEPPVRDTIFELADHEMLERMWGRNGNTKWGIKSYPHAESSSGEVTIIETVTLLPDGSVNRHREKFIHQVLGIWRIVEIVREAEVAIAPKV